MQKKEPAEGGAKKDVGNSVSERTPTHMHSHSFLHTGVTSKHVLPRLLILSPSWRPVPNTKSRGKQKLLLFL